MRRSPKPNRLHLLPEITRRTDGWRARSSGYFHLEVRIHTSHYLPLKTLTLPIDSITYGFKSTDGNGYRQALRTILEGTGNSVDMVGSVQAGTMPNNLNEGHNGATIDQIATYTSAYGQRPNVILLHAGTNDLNLRLDPATAPQRLDSLIEKLISACPDATIIVARIIPSTHPGLAALISVFNRAITELIEQRVAQREQRVMVVDMPSGVKPEDIVDGLHPGDGGYDKMAIKWAIAMTAANSMGWIEDPVEVTGISVPTRCDHDVFWMPQGEIASGGGLGANIWVSSSCSIK
jgi:lysophospholipase L1-like esterase